MDGSGRALVATLKDGVTAGLVQAERTGVFAADPARTAELQGALYPQSVASGDPRVNGIVLWTRVDSQPRGGVTPQHVGWQIASAEGFATESIVVEGIAELEAAKDNTVKVPVVNAALAPYSEYFYRFTCDGVASRTGRFKTLPEAEASLAQVRLAYVVCQDFGNGYYTALAHLAEEQVDYVVHLGDYIYETISNATFQGGPVRPVPAFPSGSTTVPFDVDDYRHLYKVYRSDVNQQAVHERFAYIQLWDDHEFANDCHRDFHPDENVLPNTATTPQPALRQAANQAWSEYGLANVGFDESEDWEHSIRVYRTFAFGRLAELIVTDERLYRDGPPCGSKEYGGRYFTLGCDEMGDRDRTMLGAEQREWFLERITTSEATWKLWANEVMLMQLKVGPVYVNLDQWDGYQQERNLILNAVKHGGVQNFVALTGDLHTFLAGYLKTDFDNPFEPHVGIELMVGSLTSANFTEEIRSDVHLPSSPAPATMMNVAPGLLNVVARASNPWIEFFDSSTHGYGVLTLTPQELTCEFKAVTTISEPAAELMTLKTFTVPVNEVKLKS